MGVFYGQVSQNANSSVKRLGFPDESRYRGFHIIRTKNPHKFHIFRDDLRVIFTLYGFMHLSVYRAREVVVPDLSVIFLRIF